MATPKKARVTGVWSIDGVTLLELEPAEPLLFVGGQYIIVDSGLVLPSGKAVKRAYSLLSRDSEPHRFQLAVKLIPGGPGSGFMHRLEVGTDVVFSGPWGKLAPRDAAPGRSLVLATDTGISAALGLVRGERFVPLLPDTVFIWLRTNADYFLPDECVCARVPDGCGEMRIDSLPPVGHPERIARVRAVLGQVMARGRLVRGFLCGDGAVNYALLDDLVAAGVAADRDCVESFFNMPKKAA